MMRHLTNGQIPDDAAYFFPFQKKSFVARLVLLARANAANWLQRRAELGRPKTLSGGHSGPCQNDYAFITTNEPT